MQTIRLSPTQAKARGVSGKFRSDCMRIYMYVHVHECVYMHKHEGMYWCSIVQFITCTDKFILKVKVNNWSLKKSGGV